MKKIVILLICFMLVTSVAAGCGKDDSEKADNAASETVADNGIDELTDSNNLESSKTDFQKIDLSSNGWEIVVENLIVQKELSDVNVMLGYSSSKTDKVEFAAEDGYKYLLMKMSISKDGSSENIEWENMYLKDADGNKYDRTDDGFLEDLNMERMPGTTLNFGSNEGWIAFSVPEDLNQVTLYYEFAKETIKCDLALN